MTGLGLIATGAAYLNYQKAKKNYDQVKENTDAVNAIMNSYSSALEQYNYLLEHTEDYATFYQMEQTAKEREQENARLERPAGLKFGVLIRVGCLVGKMMRTESVLTITNTSDQAYYIYRVEVDNFLLDAPLKVVNWKTKNEFPNYINVNGYIQPGETMYFPFPKGIAMLMDAKKDPETGEVVMSEAGDVEIENITGKLRDAICEHAGKKLITSVLYHMWYEDSPAKANVYIYWTDDPEKIEQEAIRQCNRLWGQSAEQYAVAVRDAVVNKLCKIARWQGFPALLEYKGELWT